MRTGDDNPFLLADFVLTWWKYYSSNRRLRIFVVYQDGDIIGGVPFCQNSRGYLEYPGGWAANYTELLATSGAMERVWQSLVLALAQINDWRHLRLTRYRRDRFDIDLNKCLTFASDGQKNKLLGSVFLSDCAYLIDVPEDFSAFVQSLPKKLRYYIRRALQNASERGELRLCSLQRQEEINEWFERYVHLSRESFERRGQLSAFEDPHYCTFFLELFHKFYGTGHLEAHALKLNNRIIAIHFGYTLNNNLNYVLTAFDNKEANLNPGHLLIYKLVELAGERKSRCLDFYTGHHLYKSQWSNRREEIVTIEIWRGCLRNKIERAVRTKLRESKAAGKIVAILRSCKPVRRAVQSVKSFVSRM